MSPIIDYNNTTCSHGSFFVESLSNLQIPNLESIIQIDANVNDSKIIDPNDNNLNIDKSFNICDYPTLFLKASRDEKKRGFITKFLTKRNHFYDDLAKEIVLSYAKSYGTSAACKDLKIKRRNLDRWRRKGSKPIKKVGRKIKNEKIERGMFEWVKNSIRTNKKKPAIKSILEAAQQYTIDNFKASKGWCDKFMKRNQEAFQILLAVFTG